MLADRLQRTTRKPGIRPTLERLEHRDVPSTVWDAEPNDSFSHYQPINGDTTYLTKGYLSSDTDVDYFGYYVKQDSYFTAYCHALTVSDDPNQSFHPRLELYDPHGHLAGADNGFWTPVGWYCKALARADEAGVWRMAMVHSSGPGLSTGEYCVGIGGTAVPEVITRNAGETDETTEFFIDGDEPKMPKLRAELSGVAPDPNGSNVTQWKTQVVYTAADYPAIRGVRGHGVDQATTFDRHDRTTKGDSKLAFDPDFKLGKKLPIRGGTLILSASITVRGQTLKAQTPAKKDDPHRVSIKGTDPEAAVLTKFIKSLGQPASWPAGTQYAYVSIMQKIITHESKVHQFSEGIPLWSSDNLHGAGLMQITPAGIDQTWDWQANVRAGYAKLKSTLTIAANYFHSVAHDDYGALRRSLKLNRLTVPPYAADWVVEDAIRGFNGYTRYPYLHEYRLKVDRGGRFHVNVTVVKGHDGEPLRIGELVWEATPISERGTVGDPDYVRHVLNAATF